MAETLVLNLNIDATQSAKTIEELTKRNKELAKAIRQAPREGQEGFQELNAELKKAQNEFAKNREEILKFNRSLRETDVAADSLKGLSRQLRELESEYKKLGKTAREDAFGRNLQSRIKATRNQLKKLEADLGDNRRAVGDYGKAWQKIGSKIAGVGRATGAALAVEFAFEGLQALDETITKFNDLRNTVSNFSGASGEALDQFTAQTEGIAQTFDAEADEIAKAASALSNNLNVDFGEALTLIEEGFLAGADSSGDFVSNLEGLAEQASEAGLSAEQFAIALQQSAVNGVDANEELLSAFGNVDSSLSDLIDTSDQFTNQQRDQLAANRDLAATQNQISKQLSESAASVKLLGTNIANFALTAFSELIEAVSPLTEAFGGLFDALFSLAESFGLVSEESSGFGGALDFILAPIRGVAAGVTFLVDGITALIDGFNSFVAASPALQTVVKGIGASFATLKNVISGIPAFFAGLQAAAIQAGTNIANFFRGVAIDAQILFQQLQQLNPFGPTQETIDRTIANLRTQRAELQSESVGIFEAFGTAFNEALEQQNEIADQLPEAVADAGEKVETEIEKAFREGTKKGVQAVQEETEVLAEEGSLKALQETVSAIRSEFELLAEGSDEFKDKLAELIAAEENLAQVQERIKLARETPEERQARLDAEAEAARQRSEAELQAARDLVGQVTDEVLAETTRRLSEERNLKLSADNLTAQDRFQIEQEFQRKVIEAQIQAERERLLIVDTGSKEEIQIKQNVLDLELQLIEQGLDAEQKASEERVRIKDQEAQQRIDLEKAIAAAAIDAAKTAANTALDIAKSKSEQKKNEELSILREEFAAKLELAQGNTEEEERLKAQQAAREEEIEKKAAQKEKALAITKAVINGALGAVKTIANLGFPAAIPGLIAVAAATAANIAVISAQKFAKGGIAKFEEGGIAPGRLHSQGGTPALIGGVEPVEIEVGEAIMNRRSTGRFLQTLSDINQAGGGVRFEGTSPLNRQRLSQLTAFEMMASQMPKFAARGMSPRLSASVRKFQTGGISSVQNQIASVGQQVEFKGQILTQGDVQLIAKAAAEGTRQGIEQANLFSQFKRQAEREINQENRSQV